MPTPIVTVRGEARLEGPPELATVSTTLHAAAGDAEQVRRTLAHGSEAVAGLVERFRAALDRSTTRSVHVWPVFAPRSPGRITGYAGTLSAEWVVGELAVLPDLITALTGLPDVRLDGPSWSLRPNSPLHREARLAAITDARRRAEDYAAAFGAGLVELVEVSDLDSGPSFSAGPRMAMMAKGAVEDAALVLEPEIQVVQGQVTVRFAISEVRLDRG